MRITTGLTLGVLASGLLAGAAGAEVLFTYDFPNEDSTAAGQTATPAAGVTFSDWSVVGTAFANPSNNPEVLAFDAAVTADDSALIDESQYVAFTVTVDPGFIATLTALDFLQGTGGGRGADYGEVRLLKDNLVIAVLDSAAIGSIPEGGPMDPELFDFSDLVLAAGESVEFRFFGWGAEQASNGSIGPWRLDDVALNGSVVPEPASLALVGLGGMLMLRRRASAA